MAGLNEARSDGEAGHVGDAWRDAFLTAPLWRFACVPGFFGPAGGIGVMGPGIDRRGRVFPFVVAFEADGLEDPARALAAAGSWLARAEATVLAAFDPAIDPAALGVRLPPPPDLGAMPAKGDEGDAGDEGDGGDGPRAVFAAGGTGGRRVAVDGRPTAALFRALFGGGDARAAMAEGPGGAP